MLLSLSTFLSSFPNSLPKEKGTSNASVCPPPSTLTEFTTDVSALDHRGKAGKKKIGFADTLSLAFGDNERQRYIRDGKGRFPSAFFGPPNAINKTKQRGGCWICAGAAAGLLQGKRGKGLMGPPKCKYNSLEPSSNFYSDLYGLSALGMLVSNSSSIFSAT